MSQKEGIWTTLLDFALVTPLRPSRGAGVSHAGGQDGRAPVPPTDLLRTDYFFTAGTGSLAVKPAPFTLVRTRQRYMSAVM